MAARETEHALNQPNGADAPRGERGIGPLLDGWSDALALADQPIDKRLLPRGRLRFAGAWRKHAGGDPSVHADERVHVEDADEVRIPLHSEPLAQEGEVHPEYVRRLTRQGELTRVGRGLYTLSTAEATEHHTLAEVSKRAPKAIVCLLTAARFHGLGTQNPRAVWLAVDRGAGIPRVDFTPVRVVRVSGAALTSGIDEHTVDGVRVRVTSPARTVVDCFKFRNRIGVDAALEALRDYRRLRKGHR